MKSASYLACDTQVKFGDQFLDSARGNNGKTEGAIHRLPMPYALCHLKWIKFWLKINVKSPEYLAEPWLSTKCSTKLRDRKSYQDKWEGE